MEAQPVLTTGLLGGFTTFSAASLETARDWRAGRPLRGILVPVDADGRLCVLASGWGSWHLVPAVCAVAADRPCAPSSSVEGNLLATEREVRDDDPRSTTQPRFSSRNPGFLLLWGGQALSQFGFQFQTL